MRSGFMALQLCKTPRWSRGQLQKVCCPIVTSLHFANQAREDNCHGVGPAFEGSF